MMELETEVISCVVHQMLQGQELRAPQHGQLCSMPWNTQALGAGLGTRHGTRDGEEGVYLLPRHEKTGGNQVEEVLQGDGREGMQR